MDTKCSGNKYLLPPMVVGLFFTIMLATIISPFSVMIGGATAIIGWKILRNPPSDRRKLPKDIVWALSACIIVATVASIIMAH